ncbi:MAG: hypothetical protein JWO33_143, partial [Caulobacteraceae bacterium]|nr:hypothetical protein [Caulobacteraceae bacterium]
VAAVAASAATNARRRILISSLPLGRLVVGRQRRRRGRRWEATHSNPLSSRERVATQSPGEGARRLSGVCSVRKGSLPLRPARSTVPPRRPLTRSLRDHPLPQGERVALFRICSRNLGMSAPRLSAARRMRKSPTATERDLWRLLRDRRLKQRKFRRQFPIGPYVADFACLRHRLIVEADGYWHDAAADAKRDAWLAGQGFRVLRFDNADIVGRGELVLAAILAAVRPKDDPPPAPPLIAPPGISAAPAAGPHARADPVRRTWRGEGPQYDFWTDSHRLACRSGNGAYR